MLAARSTGLSTILSTLWKTQIDSGKVCLLRNKCFRWQ